MSLSTQRRKRHAFHNAALHLSLSSLIAGTIVGLPLFAALGFMASNVFPTHNAAIFIGISAVACLGFMLTAAAVGIVAIVTAD